MPKSSHLLSAFLSVLQVSLSIVLAALLSRAMGVQDYGIYATAFSGMMILIVLSQSGLPDIVMRESARPRHLRAMTQKGTWEVADILVLPGLLIAAGIAARWLVPEGVFNQTLLLLMLACLPATAVSALRGAALRGMGLANLAHILTTVLPTFLSIAALAWLGQTQHVVDVEVAFLVVLAGFTAGACATQIARDRTLRRAGVEHRAPGEWRGQARRMIRDALPMGAIAGIAVFNSQVDVLMLGVFDGPVSAGLYQVCIQIAFILPLIKARLGFIASPDVSRLVAEGRIVEIPDLLRPFLRLSVALSLGYLALMLVLGAKLLDIGFGAEFAAAYPALIIICFAWAAVSAIGFVGPVMTMGGLQRDALRASLVSTAINVALNPPAILLFGEVGAALTLLLSVLAWHVMGWWTIRRKFGITIRL